ncbi:MAG TPA: helix-turn-helix domain-containing protein [Ktedonobacterales bacterium]
MARPADPKRRETILRAATEVFIEHGFADARLADIAARAGVVVSTLYLYFDSKEAMVSAIAGENQRRLVDELRPVLEQLHSEADITRYVAVVFAFAAAHRDAIRVFNLDSGLSAVRRGMRTTRGVRMQQGIAIIEGLIADGYLRPYDPDYVLEMLITTTRWIVAMCLSLAEGEEEPFQRFCVQWLANALLAPARPTSEADDEADDEAAP